MDRDIARSAILSICRRLRAGKEARLDKNLLASSFPRGPDGRPFEIQLVELLQATNDGIFACRPLPGGDCSVIRRVRKALVVESNSARNPDHRWNRVSARDMRAPEDALGAWA